MSDLLGDGVMHQPESNTYSEDFEKLEPDSTPDSLAEQDEEVTTTGDEAEEDRYVAGASVSDKLIEFDDESPQQSSQPSFNPDPEPFPNDSPPPTRQSGSPPPAYSQYSEFSNPPPKSFEADTTSVKKELNTIMEPTEVAKPPEGSWMKNIDPRAIQTGLGGTADLDQLLETFKEKPTMDDIPDLRTGGYGSELSKQPLSNICSPLPLLDHQGNVVSYDQSSNDEAHSNKYLHPFFSEDLEKQLHKIPHEDDDREVPLVSKRDDHNAILVEASPHRNKMVSSHEDDPRSSVGDHELSCSPADPDHHWPEVEDMSHEDDSYFEESIQRLFLEDYGDYASHEDDLPSEAEIKMNVHKTSQAIPMSYHENLPHEDDPLPPREPETEKPVVQTSTISLQLKNIPPHEDDPLIPDDHQPPERDPDLVPYVEDVNAPHEDDSYLFEESIQRLFIEESYPYDLSHEDDSPEEKNTPPSAMIVQPKHPMTVSLCSPKTVGLLSYSQNLSHEDDPPLHPPVAKQEKKTDVKTPAIPLKWNPVPPHEDDPCISDGEHPHFEDPVPYKEDVNVPHEDDVYSYEEFIQRLFVEDSYPYDLSHEDDSPDEKHISQTTIALRPTHPMTVSVYSPFNLFSSNIPHEDDPSSENSILHKRSVQECEEVAEIPSKVRKTVTPHEDDSPFEDFTADAPLEELVEHVDASDVPHEDDSYYFEEDIQRLFMEGCDLYDLSHEDDDLQGAGQHIENRPSRPVCAFYPINLPHEDDDDDQRVSSQPLDPTKNKSCSGVRRVVGLHEDDTDDGLPEMFSGKEEHAPHIENMCPIGPNMPHEDDLFTFGGVHDDSIDPFDSQYISEDILESGYLMNYALPPRSHTLPRAGCIGDDSADGDVAPLPANKDMRIQAAVSHTGHTEAIHEIQRAAPPVVEELFVNLTAVSLEKEITFLLGLIYWRDVKKSGLVFGSMMFILLSLLFFSVMSVLAYLSLAVLTVTLSFRVYKNVLQAVQKTGDGHPFKQYLEMNIELPDDKVQKAVQTVMKHVNCTVRELRRLFLIEDIVDSVKFGLLLWVLTYVGSCFNGMTLAILGVVSIFTIPKIYETYKVQIDNYVNMARTQLSKIMGQIMSKMPFPKKKVKSQ